jgi:hypothetical protein
MIKAIFTLLLVTSLSSGLGRRGFLAGLAVMMRKNA